MLKGGLPFVVDFLGETEFVIDYYFRSVVENGFSAEITEYLMGNHTEYFYVYRFVSVQNGSKIHFESSVV